MTKVKIKKGDQVVVISGKDKGTKGEVLSVFPQEGKAIVGGVSMIKKHTKPSAQNPQGKIEEREAKILISKIALVDPESGEPTRVGYKIEEGKKVRFAKKSGKPV